MISFNIDFKDLINRVYIDASNNDYDWVQGDYEEFKEGLKQSLIEIVGDKEFFENIDSFNKFMEEYKSMTQ